jgi:hypothetical protein
MCRPAALKRRLRRLRGPYARVHGGAVVYPVPAIAQRYRGRRHRQMRR